MTHQLNMRWLTSILVLASFNLSAQTIFYGWPGIGPDLCSQWINCTTGCSACNTPIVSDASVIGLGASWMDVHACPHAKGDGDNIVETSGWGVQPGTAMVVISMISLLPIEVDSIIIDHQGMEGGSERLQVRYGVNTNLPTLVVRDESVVTGQQRTVITNAGCIMAEGSATNGTAQLILQAYGGGDGWWLDNVRIVASPCMTTAIDAIAPNSKIDLRPSTDLLGRRVDADASQGVYMNARHQRVVVLP